MKQIEKNKLVTNFDIFFSEVANIIITLLQYRNEKSRSNKKLKKLYEQLQFQEDQMSSL